MERELGLDRDRLVELAMLLGSDYTEVGRGEEDVWGSVERELGLNRDRLVELAMLLGSDYTEVGGGKEEVWGSVGGIWLISVSQQPATSDRQCIAASPACDINLCGL